MDDRRVPVGGFGDATIFLVDHEQQVLTPLAPSPPELSTLDIDTTMPGRAFQLESTFLGMDAALSSEFGPNRFVIGQLATLDSKDGTLRWLNAGHPPPLLLRQGRVAPKLAGQPSLPLGLGGAPLPVTEVSLEPGDRLLFFTDGVVEARSPHGEPFGQDRLIDLTRRAMADQQTLSETVRRLVRSVRSHHEGQLDDDATILLVEWHPV